MPRQEIGIGQEIVSQDLKILTAQLERELYERTLFELIQQKEDSFFGDGLKVAFLSSTQVRIGDGLGIQTDTSQTGAEPRKRPMYRAATEDLSIIAPDGSLDRVDIVVVKAARVTTKQELRKFKDEITAVVSDQTFDVETDWNATVQIVAGTPDAAPVPPATPAGFLKIAELDVTAVSGMAGAGAITDNRTLLPTGGLIELDTSGLTRITAAIGTSLDQIIADIDALLVLGLQESTDYVDQVTDPAVPAVDNLRVYNKGGVMFTRANGGVITPLGSGAGGGGGANWTGDVVPPVDTIENNEKVYLYTQDAGQKLTLFLFVPDAYVAGRQIKMFLGLYSPSASTAFRLQTTATLVRKDLDAITSVVNQLSTAVAKTNTVANQLRRVEFDLTSAIGEINGFGVSPGDLIKVDLERPTDGGDTDTADTRFLPSATEVKF